jgi:hypothetical protein
MATSSVSAAATAPGLPASENGNSHFVAQAGIGDGRQQATTMGRSGSVSFGGALPPSPRSLGTQAPSPSAPAKKGSSGNFSAAVAKASSGFSQSQTDASPSPTLLSQQQPESSPLNLPGGVQFVESFSAFGNNMDGGDEGSRGDNGSGSDEDHGSGGNAPGAGSAAAFCASPFSDQSPQLSKSNISLNRNNTKTGSSKPSITAQEYEEQRLLDTSKRRTKLRISNIGWGVPSKLDTALLRRPNGGPLSVDYLASNVAHMGLRDTYLRLFDHGK